MKSFRIRLCLLFVVGMPSGIVRADAVSQTWPQFRGRNSNGVADTSAPIEFSPGNNELWKVDLPSGHSSPCIWHDHLLLTSFNKETQTLSVHAIDRNTGVELWQTPIETKSIEKGHPSFNPASSTPACDGTRVCAYFGSFGLICFDMEGNKLWDYPLPLAKSYAGNATSPVIVGDAVVLYRANATDNFVVALNKDSGEEIWKKKYFMRFSPSYSCAATPIVVDDMVILHCIGGVEARRIEDAKVVWRFRAGTTATSTPVVIDDHVIVATWHQFGEDSQVPPFPTYEKLLEENDKDDDKLISKNELPPLSIFHRPEGADAPQSRMGVGFRRIDRNNDGTINSGEWNAFSMFGTMNRKMSSTAKHGLFAIRLGGEGNVSNSHATALCHKAIPEVPSPVGQNGRVYMVKNGGIVTCADLKSGEQVFQRRLGASGTYYASPIIAGDLLYVTSGSGTMTVIDIARDTPKRTAKNSFGEPIYATPAVVDGKIYVRTETKLFAFGESP